MRISDVEKLVGVSKKNIRFYEEQGLLSPGREESNGYRSYTDEDVKRLRRIKLLRRLAVPISEIRKLQEGRMTLGDCMERHRIYLNNELRNIEHMKSVCADIAESSPTAAELDTERYENMISELEKGGASFVKVSDGKRRAVRRRQAITASIFPFAFFIFIACICVWATRVEEDPMPIAVMAILLMIFIPIIVCVFVALRQRLREIDQEEADETFKY